MANPNPGITFKVGNRIFDSPEGAFNGIQRRLTKLSKVLGDLTRPFDEVAAVIVPRIKARFDTGELARPPYRPGNTRRSRFTRNIRRARGEDPDGPTLKASGKLQSAVSRRPGPTKSAEGGQREVHRMTIGINSSRAPYYKEQILGGIWEVPVRVGSRGGQYFDPDRVSGASMSSSRYWGPSRWSRLSKLPEGFKEVAVPPTNIFHMTVDDESIIRNILLDYLWNAGIRG